MFKIKLKKVKKVGFFYSNGLVAVAKDFNTNTYQMWLRLLFMKMYFYKSTLKPRFRNLTMITIGLFPLFLLLNMGTIFVMFFKLLRDLLFAIQIAVIKRINIYDFFEFFSAFIWIIATIILSLLLLL
jgi:hypothetical protein